MLEPFDIKVHFEMEPWCDMRDEKKEKKIKYTDALVSKCVF